jgi:hypothetical protein
MDAFIFLVILNTICCFIWGAMEIAEMSRSWIPPRYAEVCALKCYVILCIELIFLRVIL